ncbi:MAG: amidohydrolase family protein [Henriciella sp.]|nr:amidohydrolase family protein [Henriciella sp.]MBO6696871.1 amidohydrolase family protein [Henriciella sp.]
MIRKILLSAAAAATLTLGAGAQNIAITNAKVWTGTDAGTLENANIYISNGEISGLGVNFAPPSGTELIDAEGNWVTPGIFSPFSRTGIVEVGAEDSTNDTNAAGSPFSVALRAADGFNPAATPVDVTRIEGVTRIAVAPSTGGSMIAGQGFLADTSGDADSISDDRAFVFIDLGEGGAGLAGGSRSAAWAALRGAFADARGYPARFMAHNEGDTLTRADAQAFGRAVRGQQLILISAHRASDLRLVMDLKQENPNLNLAIVGADEGWIVADELAAANIPVIVDPFQNLPASFSQLGATSKNAERLIAAGVPTAFSYLGDNGHQARLVLQSAGNAAANGVGFDDAMAAMTTVPAAIFGVDNSGTIARGSTADLVIWDGDPLEITSAPVAVFIDGEVQSLESRQTKLRDRYLELDESEKPLAYKN